MCIHHSCVTPNCWPWPAAGRAQLYDPGMCFVRTKWFFIFFLTLGLGRARPPCCLPLCLSPYAFHPLPLPLSPPLPPSHPLGTDRVQTSYPQQGVRQAPNEASVQTQGRVQSMCHSHMMLVDTSAAQLQLLNPHGCRLCLAV